MDVLFSSETIQNPVSPSQTDDKIWLSDYTPREWIALRALWHRWEELSVDYAHPAWVDPNYKIQALLNQNPELTWIYKLKSYQSAWPVISHHLLQIVAKTSDFNADELDFDLHSRKEWIHSVPAFMNVLRFPQAWMRMLALSRLRLSFHFEIDGHMKRLWINHLSEAEKTWITQPLSEQSYVNALYARFPAVRLRYWLSAEANDNQRKEKLFDLGIETFGAFINSFPTAIKTRLCLALPPKKWDESIYRSFELEASSLRHLLMELYTWLEMNRSP
ncbi:MAG: hypothetical protein V4629_11580 [Pseudomonadota bacterium]